MFWFLIKKKQHHHHPQTNKPHNTIPAMIVAHFFSYCADVPEPSSLSVQAGPINTCVHIHQ